MLEESEMHVRRLRAEGRNVTQFNLLINIGGYSYSKHACLQCFYAYRKTGEILSAHFPSATERNVFVNVPYLYKAAYTFLGDPYRKTINIYGQDQKQWESMLLEIIDKEQFPGDLISGQQVLPLDNEEGLMEWNKEL